jgi:peptidoglycan/xylan/chitin deacetylase (PgdA/CDA1 family)
LLITIDDAYRSVVEVAAPLLAERRMPAVLFTNPTTITGPRVPLDNLMALAASRIGLREVSRITRGLEGGRAGRISELLLDPIARLSLRDKENLRHDLLGRLSVEDIKLYRLLDLFLKPEHIAQLTAQGIEIANHTATHVHCRGLSETELRTEIVDAKTALEALSGRPVRAFSFPYGSEIDATPLAVRILRESGHSALFLVHARANVGRPSGDIWYRTSLTSEPVGLLPLKLSMLPRLRTLKTASKSLITSAE